MNQFIWVDWFCPTVGYLKPITISRWRSKNVFRAGEIIGIPFNVFKCAFLDERQCEFEHLPRSETTRLEQKNILSANGRSEMGTFLHTVAKILKVNGWRLEGLIQGGVDDKWRDSEATTGYLSKRVNPIFQGDTVCAFGQESLPET